MKRSSRTLRHVFGGIVLAAGISLSFAELSAMSCGASHSCGGSSVSCECEGSGTCFDGTNGAVCECDGYPIVFCSCANGCVDIPIAD